MIGYIKGSVAQIKDDRMIVEVGGIGYELYASTTVLSSAKIGEQLKLYTSLSIKDDSLTLYGFISEDEKQLFLKLTAVSGIGPKSAIALLSNLSVQGIISAVILEDVKALSSAPGIGRKTASRIIIDLKDSLKSIEPSEYLQDAAPVTNSSSQSAKSEAVSALIALGYSRAEALQAVNSVPSDGMDTEALLKQALKKLFTL